MNAVWFAGFDIHKRHITVCAVDAQQLVLEPQTDAVRHFRKWEQEHSKTTDRVALEVTTTAWELYDQLGPVVVTVAVANCHQLKLFSASKTDKHDAPVLAKLLAEQLLPTIWIPPQHVRDLHALTSHRARLLSQRSAAKNRLHALLHRHNIAVPDRDPFCADNRVWWEDVPLSPVEQLQLRHLWATIYHLNELITDTETEIARLSATEPWDELMTFLMQLLGEGLYTGMTILAAIDDIERFPSPQQLVGYAGLGARVRASGNTYRTGITKQGGRELRTALIVCA